MTWGIGPEWCDNLTSCSTVDGPLMVYDGQDGMSEATTARAGWQRLAGYSAK
jgi:hypothetical protein